MIRTWLYGLNAILRALDLGVRGAFFALERIGVRAVEASSCGSHVNEDTFFKIGSPVERFKQGDKNFWLTRVFVFVGDE
jgi:hypothetical protein|tara:strand:+ start:104 stop:340 length:237 start_codon:yes stop_codon:yes gene_type:complete